MLPKGNVSKHHARLLFRDGRFIVTDLKSTNGTYVNGRKIAQATIVREGDKIYIGDLVLRLDGGQAQAEAAMPPAGDEESVRTLARNDMPPRAPVPGIVTLKAPTNPPNQTGSRGQQPGLQTAAAGGGMQRNDPGPSHYPLERDPDDSENVPQQPGMMGQNKSRVPSAPP